MKYVSREVRRKEVRYETKARNKEGERNKEIKC